MLLSRCLEQDDPPLLRDCVEGVIRQRRNELSLAITDDEWELLRQVAQRLRELSPVPIREIVLPPSVTSFYTIKAELGDEPSDALMVFGLESVNNLDTFLLTFNQTQGEPYRSFPFPLLLWMNDEVLGKMLRLTPDLASWATNIEFVPTKEDYL